MRGIELRLKALRIKNKLSVEQIANQLGVCAKTIFNYENQVTAIPSDVLLKMADFYHVSVDYILGLKAYNSIIFTGTDDEVLAVVSPDDIVEHVGFKVVLSED